LLHLVFNGCSYARRSAFRRVIAKRIVNHTRAAADCPKQHERYNDDDGVTPEAPVSHVHAPSRDNAKRNHRRSFERAARYQSITPLLPSAIPAPVIICCVRKLESKGWST